MPLTLKQKRTFLALAEPVLRLAYGAYRLFCGERFRDRRLPGSQPSPDIPEPQRILIVRLDSIGDVLLSEPAIELVRQRFPQATIDVVVGPEGKEVLSGNPHLNSFLVYRAPWHSAWRGHRVNWREEPRLLWQTLAGLRACRYDLAFELRGDFRDIAFMALTGARVKVGNSWRGGGFLLDHDVPANPDDHRVKFPFQIVSAVTGGVYPLRSPRIYLTPEDEGSVKGLLPTGEGLRIAFHLGAGFPSKRLPLATFVQVAKALLSGDKRTAVLVGGSGEEDLAQEFCQRVGGKVVNLVGKVGIKGTAAALRLCHLFVGNDSGPMHLAAAVGTPVVTFFGPSEPWRYHPHGVEYRLLEVALPCRTCDYVNCVHPTYPCMTSIKAEDIVAAAEDLLGKYAESQRQVVTVKA